MAVGYMSTSTITGIGGSKVVAAAAAPGRTGPQKSYACTRTQQSTSRPRGGQAQAYMHSLDDPRSHFKQRRYVSKWLPWGTKAPGLIQTRTDPIIEKNQYENIMRSLRLMHLLGKVKGKQRRRRRA